MAAKLTDGEVIATLQQHGWSLLFDVIEIGERGTLFGWIVADRISGDSFASDMDLHTAVAHALIASGKVAA